MRFRVDEIAFTGPSGLEDATNYTFKAKGPREELAVELELPAGGATPAEEALADTRSQMADYLQSKFAVDEEGTLTLAGRPAPFFRYHIVDRGEPKQGFMTIANLGSEVADGDWVKLAWLLDVPAGSVRAIVDPAIASFAKASDPPPAPTPPGWVRRQAGSWAFDVPSRYSYPRTHVWLDEEAELRLSITVHPLLGPDGAMLVKPDLDARVQATEASGRSIVDREDVPIIYGQLVRVRLRDDAGDEFFACRVVQGYQFGNPVQTRWVEVAIDGLAAETTRLRQLVDALLASISLEVGR